MSALGLDQELKTLLFVLENPNKNDKDLLILSETLRKEAIVLEAESSKQVMLLKNELLHLKKHNSLKSKFFSLFK